MKGFSVNIVGLGNKAHQFDFRLDRAFFEGYGKEILEDGSFEAQVALDKHETFIEADFKIKGQARLVCDRSLEPFDEVMNLHKRVMFKYGDVPGEISDEIVVIGRDQTSLELGQLMYEFITLAVPIKKLHPRYRDEEKDSPEATGKIVYSSANEKEKIDPRWEALKKLK